MHNLLHSLGYLGVTSPGFTQWPEFATGIFGMEVAPGPGEGFRIRWDDRAYRLVVHPGAEDRIAYLGWELPDTPRLAAALDRLRAAGFDVHAGDAGLAADRMVREIAHIEDPFGIRHEFVTGPLHLDRSFRGTRSTTRFRTGAQGLGHAVLTVPDLEVGLDFYQRVLGLRCSDVVTLGADRRTMAFLRCNSRHHSIALWHSPAGLLGLQHVMVESLDINEVGRAYDALAHSRWELSSTLGRHVGDEQLSFYARTPSGFDLELGCDAVAVDESSWTMRHIDTTAGAGNEIWGHHWQPLPAQSSLHPYAGAGR